MSEVAQSCPTLRDSVEFSRPECWSGQPLPSVTLSTFKMCSGHHHHHLQNASVWQNGSPAPIKRYPPLPQPITTSCLHGHVPCGHEGELEWTVQSSALCAWPPSLRRVLHVHLCCRRCQDALPFKGGIRSHSCVDHTWSTIHPSMDARCFHVLPGVTVAAVKVVCGCLCETAFRFSWVNTSLDHVVLFVEKPLSCPPWRLYHCIDTPANSAHGLQFHYLMDTCYFLFSLVLRSHPNGCEVILLCGFHLRFPHDQGMLSIFLFAPSVCLFWRNAYSCPLPI